MKRLTEGLLGGSFGPVEADDYLVMLGSFSIVSNSTDYFGKKEKQCLKRKGVVE